MTPRSPRRARPRTGIVVALAATVALTLGVAVAPASSAVAATPTTSPGSTINTPRLTEALRAYLAHRSGQVTLALRDLTSGQTYTYRGTHKVDTASIVKVDILATLLLQRQHAHHALSSADRALATRMIEQSDNAAATALWDRIGGGRALTKANVRLGLSSTRVDDDGDWGLTRTTAADQVRLLRAVTTGTSPLTQASRSTIVHLMGSVTPGQRWGVPAANDPGTSAALKNGWLPRSADDDRWIINSIGRVHVHGHVVLLAVLSRHNTSMGDGITTVEHVATLVRHVLAPGIALLPRYGVSAHPSAAAVATGSTFGVSGTVTPRPRGTTVTLQRYASHRWATVAHGALSAAGHYALTAGAGTTPSTLHLRVLKPASSTHRAGVSSSFAVTVKARWAVTLSSAASSVPAATTVAFTAAIGPATAGSTVRLEQHTDGAWQAVATKTTGADGSCAFSVITGPPGTYTYRAVAPAAGTHLTGTSATVTITST